DPKKRVNTRPNPRLLKIKEKFLRGEEINMCFIMKYNAITQVAKGNNKSDSRTIADLESEG
ncbi:MAG TPA: hypothetical protein PLE82_06090, partial [Saccharofermentans sp.]|nr:hypothetical protein [Saccharofermentans sp.]